MAEGGLPHLDELVTTVRLLARARASRLVALVVGYPAGLPPERVAAEVSARLLAAGFEGVEVTASPVGGPVRVLSVEFTR